MLISEFSGCSRAFTGFLEYNPFSVNINIIIIINIVIRVFKVIRFSIKYITKRKRRVYEIGLYIC
jgi:hypothetical protein